MVQKFVGQLIGLLNFWIQIVLLLIKKEKNLILLHPQNLGYSLSLRLLESREAPALIYLLDSSFFCAASYNYIPGENAPCVRCIDFGFDERLKNGCRTFPRNDSYVTQFGPRLKMLVNSGRVRIAAQNLRQAELAKRHFQLAVQPPAIGLWTRDWDGVFLPRFNRVGLLPSAEYTWDVLFHGHCLDAKGASWTLKLAQNCTGLRFLFPFTKPDWLEAPANCSFTSYSWEDGLVDQIRSSRYVAVPSLWSAPIEGALVKSIACARAVLVVDNKTSFSDELPDGLVLKLPCSPSDAALALINSIKNNWSPDSNARNRWLESFSDSRSAFVTNLLLIAGEIV